MSQAYSLPNPAGARLARSSDGGMVHTLECRYARAPWNWTADKFPHEVLAVVERMGYKLCGHCMPLAAAVADVLAGIK